MRKYVWLIGILVIALLVVPFMVGCGSKQQSGSVTTASGEKSAEEPTGTAGGGANTLGDLMKKHGELSSYVMTTDTGGMKTRTAMKMADGKPVAMKVDTGQGGWMIMRLDKKMQYMYNPATKSVMAMPMTGTAQSAPSKGPLPDAEAMKALGMQKTTSETLDGVDCLKMASSDGKKAYWVEKEHGLPVQVTDGGKTMKFKYEQINSVPDSTFEVPAGIKTQEMPKMPGMPNMPKMPK